MAFFLKLTKKQREVAHAAREFRMRTDRNAPVVEAMREFDGREQARLGRWLSENWRIFRIPRSS